MKDFVLKCLDLGFGGKLKHKDLKKKKKTSIQDDRTTSIEKNQDLTWCCIKKSASAPTSNFIF